MTSFYDLPHNTRFQVYGALKALECETGKSGGSGQLCVAVARGKFGELTHALEKFGLKLVDSYLFPLGSDNPPRHTCATIPSDMASPTVCGFMPCSAYDRTKPLKSPCMAFF